MSTGFRSVVTVAVLLVLACRQTSREAGSPASRGDVSPTAADSARWDSLRARQDSVTAVTHRRLIPLTALPTPYAVCRLSHRDPLPGWATSSSGSISSVTRTAEELSIIVADSHAPRNVRCERDWRVIKVRGPLPLDLIGIIAGISTTLAGAGISIFAFSTYDTDHVMVKRGNLDRALRVLREAEYPILGPILRDSSLPLSVKPLDEGATDPDFFLFRARLQTAVANHDTAEVMRVVDRDILNSFGGDGGREEFRERWRLETPGKSQLWGTLGFVLGLGGRFIDDTLFYAPYVSYGGVSGDGFQTLVVLGSNIPVHDAPAATAVVIDTVSFEEVTKWRGKSTTGGWEPIRTSRGRTGWVLQRHLRSPIDYRAGFVRREGRWWLRTLVAGD